MSDPRLLKTSLTAIALAVLGGTAGAQTALNEASQRMAGGHPMLLSLGGDIRLRLNDYAGARTLFHEAARRYPDARYLAYGEVDAALAQMTSEGIDAGRPVAASRGAFSWRIALREDGRRLRRENLPTLIEWGAGSAHPSAQLPEVGVQLQSFEARDGISAVLSTPLGERRLVLIG